MAVTSNCSASARCAVSRSMVVRKHATEWSRLRPRWGWVVDDREQGCPRRRCERHCRGTTSLLTRTCPSPGRTGCARPARPRCAPAAGTCPWQRPELFDQLAPILVSFSWRLHLNGREEIAAPASVDVRHSLVLTAARSACLRAPSRSRCRRGSAPTPPPSVTVVKFTESRRTGSYRRGGRTACSRTCTTT